MNEHITDALDLHMALVRALGLRVISGGAPGEIEGAATTDIEPGADAGDGGAGDDAAAGAEGVEGAEGAEGDAADGEGDEFDEGDGDGQDDDGDGQGGEAAGGKPGRANSRIRELVARGREVEARLAAAEARLSSREEPPKGREPFTPEEKYAKVHETLGGYLDGHFKHGIEPVARAILQTRSEVQGLVDRMEFYGDYPQFNTKKQRGIIERAHSYLQSKSREPVAREDALYYLQGHPKYSKLFVTEGQRQRSLDTGLTAARRRAGRMAGNGQMRVRGAEAPDTSRMTPEELVAHVEKTHGSVAI